MSDKAEIKKIVLQLDDKEIELSIEQAKKLKSLLGNLFEEKTIFIDKYVPQPYPVYPQYPYWKWNQPFYGNSDGNLQFKENYVLCSVSGESK